MNAPEQDHGLRGRSVLVVEDDARLRKRLEAILRQQDADVAAVDRVADARAALTDRDFDLVLLDVHLPDGSGIDLLREGTFPEATSVVVMTGDGGVETAVEAMRCGAADYLAKPLNPFELPLVFARCRERQNDRRRRAHQQARAASREGGFYFGRGLAAVREQMDRILEIDWRLKERLPPVLILGETGTGKSTLARMIHEEGPRRQSPFIEVNCSVLPESLIESELFGHQRGAFTDARETRIGLFEAAEKGTLFLDEISTLPPSAQAKLLTAVEQQRIRRVGSSHEVYIDVRVMAATLENLEAKAANHSFRADLYHRLNVLRIDIPPLRVRKDDILPLANHLLRALKPRYRIPEARISAAAHAPMRSYPWPGNVRELEHELERQLILSGGGELDFSGLARTGRSASLPDPSDWLNPQWTIPESGFSIESALHRLIDLAIQQSQGNLSAAARLLGVNRDYLRYRLKKQSDTDPPS